MDFDQWLISEKGYSKRSSRDAVYRLKRICRILGTSEIPHDAVSLLENNSYYKELSVYVRSQLKRASHLFEEYCSRFDA